MCFCSLMSPVLKTYDKNKNSYVVLYGWRRILISREVKIAYFHIILIVGNNYANLAAKKILHPIREILTKLLLSIQNVAFNFLAILRLP